MITNDAIHKLQERYQPIQKDVTTSSRGIDNKPSTNVQQKNDATSRIINRLATIQKEPCEIVTEIMKKFKRHVLAQPTTVFAKICSNSYTENWTTSESTC